MVYYFEAMLTFSRAQGLNEAKAFLSKAVTSSKFPHALLVHGPEGVGQNPLMLDLIDILICENPETRPCEKCSGCLGRKRNNLDNLIFIIPLEKKEKAGEGEMEVTQVDELVAKTKEFHDDPYGFRRSEKSRINIAQIRDLQGRLSFTEASGRPRIAVILWAETMPHEAANALLKSLEEPPPNTYFLLSTEDRASLLPTILSRCTQLALFPMEAEAFATTLASNGKTLGLETVPARLLPFAEGSLGTLLALSRSGGDTLVVEAGHFLDAALSGDWLTFSDYLDGSDAFADMDSTSRLMNFLLRLLRVFHRLVALEGPISKQPETQNGNSGSASSAYAWTREALRKQGFDPELSSCLGHLESGPGLEPLAGFLEAVLAAVQSYAKPRMATLGLYLEFEAKYARKDGQPC